MSSAVAELDGILQSMLSLKAPGVSGSKISAITTLCNANIQSESVLIQKIYTHFKKTPGTHKLGVLYAVDSVTRQWVDQAKKAGQPLTGASDGTFAAGVARVTELLPVLMSDIINSAPEDQKAKIKKLIEIWERSSTFPAHMLADLKEKLDAPRPATSTTPVGSPRPGLFPLGQQQQSSSTPAPAPTQDTSAILEALKNMAKQSSSTPQPQASAPAQAPANPLAALFGNQNANANAAVSQGSPASNAQAVNPLAALLGGNAPPSQQNANVSNPLAAMYAQQQPHAAAPASAPVMQPGVSPDMQTQLQLIQLMAAQGIPSDQWGTALQLLSMQGQGNGAGGALTGAPFPPPGNGFGGQNGDQSRDRDGYPRSPPGQFRRRSRSPDYDRRRDLSPRGRRNSPGFDGYRDGRRGNEYRQRSPTGRRRASPPPSQQNDASLPPPGPKDIRWDKSLPPGSIKVLSRTLFVGGVTSSDAHLKGIFSRFGVVQTCIVNLDKRHAFIKMINRRDSEAARNGMEEYKDGNTQLRTKWGVGFGPRDCSDYQTGVSIIPIDRLTEADRKWLLTADYGGTGGAPIEHGMVLEEPDIEIGAGVSSKAMSRRIATDKGGVRGPQSSGRRDRGHRDDSRGADNNPNNMPLPQMNGFPMMANGMPMIPGFPFSFPGQQQNSG